MDSKLANNDEFFQGLLDMTVVEGEIEDILSNIEEAETSYEAYEAIHKCIQACGGVSKSLESMFGENFSSAASMEVESVTAKQGFIEKIIQWVKDFFAKIWAWFKSWFQTRDGMIKELTELKEKADYVKYPVIIPNYFHALLKAGMGAAFMAGVASVADLTEEYLKDVEEAQSHIKTPEEIQEHAERSADIAKGSIIQAVANTATDMASGSWSRISHKWKYIKAHISIDAHIGAQGNTEIKTPGVLRAELSSLIAELKLSKKISDNYSKLHDSYKSFLESEKAFLPGLQAKSMVIYVWKENQKFFRALLRYSNLILQRAEVGNTPTTGSGSSNNSAPAGNKGGSSPSGNVPSSNSGNNGFKHGAYWEQQNGVWVPVAEGNLKHE